MKKKKKKKSKENCCPKIQNMERKKKVLVSVLKLRNFSWMNCVLLGVLARLYLDDMTLEANIFLLFLLAT
jgi:hypothetical protein